MGTTDSQTSSNQGTFKVIIGVLVGVLALLGYLFMGARNETIELQKSLTSKVEQLSSTQIKLDSISKSLDQKIAEVQSLGGSIAELEEVKAQLENDKKKLKSDFSFSSQKYEAKIKDYESFLVAKDDDIRKLKEENGILVARTQTLETEKQQVVFENTSLKTEKEELSTTLTKTVDDFTAKNNDLKRQVTLASAMKAVNVQVTALTSKGKERDGGAYKASRIDQLKVSFIMPTNPIAAQNNKDIYIRVLDANGAVLENGNGGIVQADGKEIGYSFKQSVPFENNDQRVNIVSGKGATYSKGKYDVELYSEGFKIGKGSFEVK
jgi:predicted  nucleic acid-binding Zn-ribbon protein